MDELLKISVQSYSSDGLMKELTGIHDIYHCAYSHYEYNGRFYKCSHQKRISNGLLKVFAKKVERKKMLIHNVADFNELYEHIESCRIRGIGRLTIYDCAIRIGYILKPQILPTDVYLNAGAFKGAQALYELEILREKPRYIMPIDCFPGFLDGMSAIFIEDYLCVNHKILESILAQRQIEIADNRNLLQLCVGHLQERKQEVITIKMDGDHHKMPHIHIDLPGNHNHVAGYSIDSGKRIEGEMSPKNDQIIKDWILVRKQQLLKVWNALKKGDPNHSEYVLEIPV